MPGSDLKRTPKYGRTPEEHNNIKWFSPTRPSGPSWSSSRNVRVWSFVCLSPSHAICFEASHWPISPPDQRWKNVPACQQCWCKFFPSSGKMCAKFYAVFFFCKSELCRNFAIFWVILKGFYLVNCSILLSKEDFIIIIT